MKIEQKLNELGIVLPEPPAKGGLYAPAKIFAGNLVYVSGCGPSFPGENITGKCGENVTAEQGYVYAKKCMMNVLALLKRELGSLDRVKCVAKITCFVASATDFYAQPDVANGATQLLKDIFGEENGLPSRSAIGMAVLPNNMPVEVEALFEIEAE